MANLEEIRARERSPLICTGESRTEQSHKSKVNINTIMRRYQKTRLLPNRGNQGFYGDFSNVEDYHSCANALLAAEDAFMSLPATLRKQFANSPEKLLEFLADENNRDQAIELGLIPKPEPEYTEPAPDSQVKLNEAAGDPPTK